VEGYRGTEQRRSRRNADVETEQSPRVPTHRDSPEVDGDYI